MHPSTRSAPSGSFPSVRLRRLRQQPAVRALLQETHLARAI